MAARLAGRATRATLAVGLAIAAALCLPTAAVAHNYVVSTTPAEGGTLTELPEQFVITTNDVLLELGGDGGFAMQVADASGLYYGDGCVTVDGPSMSTPAALGSPGDYVLEWQAVSADGHTISGEIPFNWSPATAVHASEGSASPPECGVPAEEAPTDDAREGSGETGGDSEASVVSADLAWIAGAVVIAVVAVIATLLLARRRTPVEEPTPGD